MNDDLSAFFVAYEAALKQTGDRFAAAFAAHMLTGTPEVQERLRLALARAAERWAVSVT